MQLAIVGMGDATGDDLVKVVNRLGLAASVRLYRHLGDAGDMSALLSAADIAAIPFTAAGFPGELLDAWATRAAVLTSDSGSTGEVAGDGAMCVDPNDAGAIARGLGRMFRDARLRRELADRGQQRLQPFTRENAAEQLAAAVERATGTRTLRRPADDQQEPLRKAA
jgi:glycosyltransferase involved in cell wall biosynthesis